MTKGPPTLLESERVVIGAMLRTPEAAEIVASELMSSDFYQDTVRKAFIAAKDLADSGLEANRTSVFERSGIAQAELDDMYDHGCGVTSSQLKTLCAELQRVSHLRTIHAACTTAVNGVGKDSKVEDILQVLEDHLLKATRVGGQAGKDVVDATEPMGRTVSEFIRRANSGGGPEISTGLADLDKAIIGLRPGKMFVVAGRPGMGKTALADTIRRSVLTQSVEGLPLGVIHFNLEMSAEEIMERELAFSSGLNLRKIMSGKDVSNEDVEAVINASNLLSPGRWFIDDSTYSIGAIRRRARAVHNRMSRQGIKTGLVILDYIQLAGENGEGREQSVASISRTCKLLSKELKCTVMALSQLNRACENREDRRPMTSDLRESGTIEQDADIIGFVYREFLYDSSVPPEEAELIIAKQRGGPTGPVHLRYNTKRCFFHDRATNVGTGAASQHNEAQTL